MATVNSQMNNFLKFLQMLTSGDFASVSGTADPMAVANEQISAEPDTALSESYMNSSNEDIKRVFSGLIAGQLDPVSAKQELISAFADQPDLVSSLGSAVDSVVKEQAAARKARASASKTQGYLPKMTERYQDNPSIAPLLPKAQQAIGGIDKRLALLNNLVPQTKRGTLAGPAKEQATNFGVMGEDMAKGFAALDPQAKEMLMNRIRTEAQNQSALRNKVVAQNAATLEQAGRSPYQDALANRAAALLQFLKP